MNRLFGTILLALALNGCAIIYQQDIQQGNFLKQEEIDLVETGMTRDQVLFALGTPMVEDPFNKHRWDYAYYLDSRRQKFYAERRVSIFFDESGRVREIQLTGD